MKPKIVCYCGSLRVAREAFKNAECLSVMEGIIALLPCCMWIDIQREYGAESEYKQKADELHKRRIDICDEVYILNVNGYIGESTRSEIEYAQSIGKPIKYLESLDDDVRWYCVDCHSPLILKRNCTVENEAELRCHSCFIANQNKT